MKAANNRSLELSEAESRRLLARCVRPEGPLTPDEALDRILPGDSLELLELLPRGFADLLIADPPYNLTKDYNGSRFARMREADYAAYTEAWLDAIGPILARRLRLQNRITWQREKGRGARHNWKNVLEDIWFATVSADYRFHPEAVMQRRRVLAPYREGGRPKDWEENAEGRFRNSFPSNFWDDISVPFWSMPENTPHPAQKPEKLMAKLILASSDPGDIVLDPFLGSGSSAVTAKKLGRHYVGIEREAAYCAWAEKRLELAETDKRIQGYVDGVFWERNTAALMKKHRG